MLFKEVGKMHWVALACAAFGMGASEGNAAPPQEQAKVTLSIPGPRPLGRSLLKRGEISSVHVTFEGAATSGKLRLWRIKPSPGKRLARLEYELAYEYSVYLAKKPRYHVGMFTPPLTMKNGNYELEAEVPGVGTSSRLPVAIGDPPVRLLGVTTPKTFGGVLVLRVNHVPPKARVAVTRTSNAPFPPEWWSPYKSVGSKSSLVTPQISMLENGSWKLEAKLSDKLGAGAFRAQLLGDGVPAEAKEYIHFSFGYPASKPALYQFRFESMHCIEETNEVGDEEIYTVHMGGAERRSRLALRQDDFDHAKRDVGGAHAQRERSGLLQRQADRLDPARLGGRRSRKR
jgi:hypothetical protein